MSTVVKDLGAVSAYAYAVEKGYTGTEAEFAELMADYAEVGQRAEDAAGSALNSKTAAQTAATTATNKASEATTAAQTATTKAGEAQTSAQTASSKASEASQSASQASGYAQTAETAKTDAQTAKTQADTARDEAVTAKTAAETAQGKAEDAQAAAESVAESIPSDYSQLSEDVSDLKEEFTAVEDLLVEDTYIEVPLTFDISGYYKYGNLSNLDTSSSDSKSCIISVTEGDKYKVTGQSNYGQKLVCVYDSNDNILLTIKPENNSQTLTDYEFTIPSGGVKMSLSYLHNYAAYMVTLKKAETTIKPISADNLDIFETAEPINILNYEEAITGGLFNPNGTVTTNVSTCRVFVPVHGGTAVCHVNTDLFGETLGARIPYFDANKNYLGYIQGTIIGDGFEAQIKVLQITIPSNAKYIGISNRTVYINRVMVVYGTEMPTEFIPYLAEYKHLSDDLYINSENVKGSTENPLFNKTVAFDGDSICHGISANDGKSGWAGRIGKANEMNWKNYGVSGGTITNNHSHCIMNAIEDIHKYLPTLDYYIFEGGTNDADHLGISGIGAVVENDFSGTYDTSTFSGAFETLVYRALTYYPTAKIGYIVAQKMGKTNNANYAKRKAFFDRAMEICKKWGIPYINLWDGSHLNPNLSSMYDDSIDASGNISANKLYIDGQHLTPTGYDVVTPIIEAWMKTL